MTTDSLFEYLLELNQEAANELIKTYHNEGNKDTLLIFPKKRNDKVRISEQELRFVMTNLHGRNNYLNLNYAVEVPTEQPYSFSGKNKRSGSTDLAFYDGNKKVLNVELKSNNPSQETINKDIEKLMNEETYGAWCHIFNNEDSGTLKSVFQKLTLAINNNKCKTFKPLFFSFLILNKKTLITRKGKDGDEKNFNPDLIFSLKYSDYKELARGKHFRGLNDDWQIDKF